MGLFDRVFRGSDEMFAKAQETLLQTIEELGAEAPMAMPDTGYLVSCIYAYTGRKVAKLAALQDALSDVKAMMTRHYRTHDISRAALGPPSRLK
jgi:hypothetical protein